MYITVRKERKKRQKKKKPIVRKECYAKSSKQVQSNGRLIARRHVTEITQTENMFVVCRCPLHILL